MPHTVLPALPRTPRRGAAGGTPRWRRPRPGLSALATIALVAGLLGGVAAPAHAAADLSCTNPSLASAATPLAIPGGTIGVFSDVEQILPVSSPNGGAASASACLARNTLASFQIVVSSDGPTMSITGVGVDALTGPGGAVLAASNIRFFREDAVALTTMSDASFGLTSLPRNSSTGACTGDCRLYDALVPTVDPATGAARSAFPASVKAGKNRAIWVDVFAPAAQPAGHYSGAISVSVGGTARAVPLSVDVLPVVVPSYDTAQAEAAGTDISSEFRLDNTTSWATTAMIARLGLENRMSVWRDGVNAMSASEWTTMSALLSGTDGTVRQAGSELRNVSITSTSTPAALSDLKAKLTSIGAADKAFFWCDEGAGASCATRAATVRNTWAGLPVIAISDILGAGDPLTRAGGAAGNLNGLAGVRALVPLSTYLDPAVGKDGINPYLPASTNRASRGPAYTQWRANGAGREFWSYVSCMSEGCNAAYIPSSVYAGWPSYAIDKIGTAQPALGWQAVSYDIDGEHYWTSNRCAKNPTVTGQCLYDPEAIGGGGSNGDGTLFYSSTQFGLAGAAIPVESLRVKRIRDGRQAYALVALAGAAGRGAAATAIVTSLYPEMAASAPTVTDYEQKREQLLELFASSVPGSPTGVIAVSGAASGTATLTWQAPQSDGGSAIVKYTATSKPTGKRCVSTGALGCTMTGLKVGGRYTFTVTATNAGGVSLPSSETPIVTIGAAATPTPSAPTAVTATAGDGAATVSWTASAAPGGAATSYTALSTPGAKSCTTAGTSCVVTGLQNGGSYTFTVTATNAAGSSPASTPSAAVTPRLPSLTATAAPTISGSPVVGGSLTATTGSWTGVWGLDGVVYAFQWRRAGVALAGAVGSNYSPVAADAGAALTVAVTASGPGYTAATAVSPPVAVAAAATAPGAPTGVTAVAGDGEAAVTWTAPASNGGSPITSYTVTSSPGGKTCTTASTSCPVSGLFNGTAYTFRVTASNSVGTSPASAASAAVTPRLPQLGYTGTPVISGTAKVGSTLTASNATWSGVWGLGGVTYAYQWRRNGVAVAGATATSYTAVAADANTVLTVAVTASGPGYTPNTAVSPGRTVAP